MSLIDAVKKRIPLASDPTPRADVSAADFEEMDAESVESDSDANQQNGDASGGDDQPEQSGGQSGEQENSPTESGDESGDGDSDDSDTDTPSEEGQSSLTDFNSNGDESGESGDEDGESGDGSANDGDDEADSDDVDSDGSESGEAGDESGDGDETSNGNEDGSESSDTEDGDGDGENDDADGNDEDETGSETGEDGDGNESEESDGTDEDGDGEDGFDDSDTEGGDGGESPETEVEPDNSSPSPPGFGEEPYEPHPDLVESEKNRTEQEKKDLEDELEKARQEHEKFKQALSNSSGNGRLDNIQFNVNPDSTAAAGSRWNDAVNRKDRILRLLATHLKRERRDSWKRGQNKGRLDSKRLHAVKAKRLDVMKKRDPGKEKRYSAIIVLDRSGSMSGEKINIAEQALSTYALALEELGIDVMVMDMYRNNARIISPFGVDVEHAKDDLMSKKASLGTPLSDALEVARKRMELASEEPFLITITDGNPNNASRYQEQLSKTYMPVMGITIKPRGRFDNPAGRRTGPHEQYYDMHTYVASQEELEQQLEQLTMQIAF